MSSPQSNRSHRPTTPAAKRNCPHCRRARWLLTVLMLATMAVILYLNQFAS